MTRKISYLFVCLLVYACSSSDGHDDLRQWMSEESKKITGKIPPLPEVKPYEAARYDASNFIDPFKPAKIGVEKKKGGGGLQPDMERPREPLEAYPLESLKYVGVLSKKNVSYAIVQVDGSLFQAKVGHYMGQNFGMITKISESEVILKELVQDASGGWVERSSTLLLQGQEEKK